MTRLKTSSLALIKKTRGRAANLSREEEFRLIKLIKTGDIEALGQLIRDHLPFVVAMAKCYQTPRVPLNVLIIEGTMALVEAAKNFDFKRGCRFITYAVWKVNSLMQKEIRPDRRALTIPMPAVVLGQKFNKMLAKLEQVCGRQISWQEIENLTAYSWEEIKEASMALQVDVRLFDPLDSDGRIILDTLPDHSESPDHQLIRNSLQEDIDYALTVLTPQEAELISLYYGLNDEPACPNLAAIARRWGISRQYARDIMNRALNKLRQSPKARILRQHLG